MSLLSQPTLRGDRVVFVAEDDLWTCALAGGDARRLTNGAGVFRTPRLSPDGSVLAACASEEGVRDVVVLDAAGGPLARRTWHGASDLKVLGFDASGAHVLYATAADGPFALEAVLWSVPVHDGLPERTGLGGAQGAAFQEAGRVVCRHSDDLARWRGYRGGRTGQLWVDPTGTGAFARLPLPDGNVASPMWWGERVVFVSDHDGQANLWSCRVDGSGLTKHTTHTAWPVRHPAIDGDTVVYALAGDVWALDLPSGESAILPIVLRSQRTATQTRHPSPASYVEHVGLHPDGASLALTVRGQVFAGGHWEGPLPRLAHRHGVRRRLACWLDADTLLWASDDGGVDHLERCTPADGAVTPIDADLGRTDALEPSPDGQLVAVVGPHDLLRVLDPRSGAFAEVARSPEGPPHSPTWSPDGRWLAWVHPVHGWLRSAIRMVPVTRTDEGVQIGPVVDVTDGRYRDRSPDFDPLGRYLYFLSDRELDPVRDTVYFDYAFPRGSRPYLVTLQDDGTDPFEPPPRHLGKPKPPKPPETLTVHTEGIAQRVVRFRLSEGRYTAIAGLPSGRVLLQRSPVTGTLGQRWGMQGPPDAVDELFVWDWDAWELSSVHTKVTGFTLDGPRKTAVVRSAYRLRVIPADPDKAARTELKRLDGRPGRKSGWLDPSRVRLAVDPVSEWHQMAAEAWRLMRDNVWDPSLVGASWEDVRARHLPLVDRVSSRSELSDLLTCMQAELGLSHAYELGGDHPPVPTRTVGRLAADLAWDGEAWRVERLHAAEPGDAQRTSPLTAAGVGAREGTRIHAVDGEPVQGDRPIGALLVGASGRSVSMELSDGDTRRTVWVRPLGDDSGARMRSWVASNRVRVHEATGDRVGYVHVPDMGPQGYADFHRDFLGEASRDGLIVDVRYNRGGHVSQLLLGRLIQRRTGWVVSRSHGQRSWPAHAAGDALVALTNAYAGSDGDIFSHQWKALGLGPLVGVRTWGGVVGIMPRRPLVDRTMTTQPEFANWFTGVGYGVENFGVEPDVLVEHPPGDTTDAQLDRAIALALERLASSGDPARPRS